MYYECLKQVKYNIRSNTYSHENIQNPFFNDFEIYNKLLLCSSHLSVQEQPHMKARDVFLYHTLPYFLTQTPSLNPKLPDWLDWLEQQTLMIFLPPSPSSWIVGYSSNSTILSGCWGSKLKTSGRYSKHLMHEHSELMLELLVPV